MAFTPYSRYEYQDTDLSGAEGWHRDPGPENIWAKQEIEITGEVQRINELPSPDPDAETEDGQRRTYYVRTRGAVYRDIGDGWEVIWGRGDADYPLPGTSYFEGAQVENTPSTNQDVVRKVDLDPIEDDITTNSNDIDALETEMEIRDLEANRSQYSPSDGRKFLATDTGRVFIGDGTAWTVSPVGVTPGITEREPQGMTVMATQTALLQLRQFEQFSTEQISIEDGGSMHIRKIRYTHDI